MCVPAISIIATAQPLVRVLHWLPVSRLPRRMAVTGSFHGRERFDPLLILAQIVLLQACFYISYVRVTNHLTP